MPEATQRTPNPALCPLRKVRVDTHPDDILGHGGHGSRQDDDHGAGRLPQGLLVLLVGEVQQPHEDTATAQHVRVDGAGLRVEHGVPSACRRAGRASLSGAQGPSLGDHSHSLSLGPPGKTTSARPAPHSPPLQCPLQPW